MDVKSNTRVVLGIPADISGGVRVSGGRASAWLRRAVVPRGSGGRSSRVDPAGGRPAWLRRAVVRVAPAGWQTLSPVSRRWPEARWAVGQRGRRYARLRLTHARLRQMPAGPR